MRKLLEAMISEVNACIVAENNVRERSGTPKIRKGNLYLMGQMSLLVNDEVAAVLALVQTADVDAMLDTEYFVLQCLQKILKENGLQYDLDSDKIWLPKDKKFRKLFEESMLSVHIVDPESALLSKAIKAPIKNRMLIREAIASEIFPDLIDRILEYDGDLDFFLKE